MNTDQHRIRSYEYSWSSLAFFGLAFLILLDIVLAGIYNPDRHELEFWLMLLCTFGGLLGWSLWIGWRLSRGTGVVAAYSFLGLLTSLIAIGACIQFFSALPHDHSFPGSRALQFARIVTGVYLLCMWAVVIKESTGPIRR